MAINSPASPSVQAMESRHFTHRARCGISQQIGNDATRTDGGGYDLSDRMTSFKVNASMDNSMVGAEVRFSLGRGARSLSPLVSTSPKLGGRTVIQPHNTIGFGLEIANSVFDMFTGRIDRVSLEGDEVVVKCRDWGAYLQEAAIRETAMYGSDGGTPAETVIRSIFTDNGWSSFQLDVSGSPGFDIFPYPVGEIGSLEAARIIAQQIGWDVRWFPTGWRDRPGGALVHLYDPNRERTDVDAVLHGGRYDRIEAVEWGDEDVRNDWMIYWQDPTTGLPVGLPAPLTDADSIGLYARRKARIYLQRAENIRDETGGTAFGNAALADSKDPFVGHRITMPIYPNVTLNDRHTYLANPRYYDQDLTLAVVAYTHTWSSKPNTQAKTTIGARGKPLAAYRDYRRSVPPKSIMANVPPTTEYAPEGTIIYVRAA